MSVRSLYSCWQVKEAKRLRLSMDDYFTIQKNSRPGPCITEFDRPAPCISRMAGRAFRIGFYHDGSVAYIEEVDS